MKVKIRAEYLVMVGIILLLAAVAKSQESVSGNLTINATVGQVVSITLSESLQQGIMFGNLQPGTNNNMALNNTGVGNCTNYSISVDSSSTSSVNMWHRASGNLTSSSNTILIGNLTHEANKTWDGENVNMSLTFDGTYQLTLSYAKIGNGACDDTQTGGSCYIAYWLDVPTNIPSGVYETTYWYCVNATLGSANCE